MTSNPFSFEDIHSKALELGWDDAGITDATIPEEDTIAYKKWLANDCHGELAYMENQMRCHPEELFPGAKTAIIFVSYYKQEEAPFRDDAGVVASYARGRDYHNVHRRRLKKMIRWMEEKAGQEGIARGFSDSAPVLEKALAVKAGLGWFGKNTLLIHRKFGTFTLLSGLFTSLDIPFSPPRMEMRLPRCGSCTRCMDACPVDALTQPYLLDSKKCLSYHLIESKKPLSLEIQEKNPGYAFGCDLCQDACPHNFTKALSTSPDFQVDRGRGAYIDQKELDAILEDESILNGTPLKRRGAKGLEYTLGTLKLAESQSSA